MTDKISRQRKQNENLKQKQKQLKHILFSTIAEIKKGKKHQRFCRSQVQKVSSFAFFSALALFSPIAYIRLESLANVSL